MTDAFIRGCSKPLKIILNILGLAAVLTLILKVPYGYGTTDECYYLISPIKVLQGDAMLKDEWFVAQLSGFLLMPLIKLYLLIAGSTEGIILAFRYMYVAVKVMSAVFVYRRLKRITHIFPAFLGTLLFLIYTPFDIMALSYNTIGHICMCMSMAVMVSMQGREIAASILAGLLYAAAVLCCPYLIVIYILYTILVIAACRFARANDIAALKGMTWIFITAAAAALAVIFAVFLLSGASITELMSALPHILSNPTHQPQSIFVQFKEYLGTIFLWDKKRLIILLLMGAMCVVMLFARKAARIRWIFFVAAVALTAMYCLLPGYIYDMANHFILPVNILGFVCFFMADKRRHGLFWGMWVPGIIYSFAIFLSSNQAFYVLSSASIVSAPASFIFITEAVCAIDDDIRKKKETALSSVPAILSAIAGLAFMAAIIAAVGISVWNHCFWDKNRSELNIVVEEGCEKGTVTCSDYYDSYMNLRSETEKLRNISEGRVLYYTEMELWLKLDDPKQAGSCFSYFYGSDEYKCGELKTYYEMYPDKTPQACYFEKSADIDVVTNVLGLDPEKIITTASGNHIYIK